MSLRVQTSEFMLSTKVGLGMRETWFPRVVAEAFLGSEKDGEINLCPDPVTLIDGSLSWYNNSDDPQHCYVSVTRAPRGIVAQNPGTVVIHDAWAWDVAVAPQADYPGAAMDTMGGRFQVDRGEVGREDLRYGRYFLDLDARQAWCDLGVVPPMQAFHFRYVCSVQTPGIWLVPTEFESRTEVAARWVRLIGWAMPASTPTEAVIAGFDEYADDPPFGPWDPDPWQAYDPDRPPTPEPELVPAG